MFFLVTHKIVSILFFSLSVKFLYLSNVSDVPTQTFVPAEDVKSGFIDILISHWLYMQFLGSGIDILLDFTFSWEFKKRITMKRSHYLTPYLVLSLFLYLTRGVNSELRF